MIGYMKDHSAFNSGVKWSKNSHTRKLCAL